MKKLNIQSILLLITLIFSACTSGPQRESTGEYIDSAAITTKIKTALAQDDRVSAMDVHVKTYKGIVQLSGFVETKDQRAAAEEIAEAVEGVKDVKNDIRIK